MKNRKLVLSCTILVVFLFTFQPPLQAMNSNHTINQEDKDFIDLFHWAVLTQFPELKDSRLNSLLTDTLREQAIKQGASRALADRLSVKVVVEPEPNVILAPDQVVYVTTGLLEMLGDQADFASVMAAFYPSLEANETLEYFRTTKNKKITAAIVGDILMFSAMVGVGVAGALATAPAAGAGLTGPALSFSTAAPYAIGTQFASQMAGMITKYPFQKYVDEATSLGPQRVRLEFALASLLRDLDEARKRKDVARIKQIERQIASLQAPDSPFGQPLGALSPFRKNLLLEYTELGDRIVGFCTKGGVLRGIKTFPSDRIKSLAKAFRRKILSGDPSYCQEGYSIYRMLIEPFSNEIRHEKEALLSTSGFLQLIPYEALCSTENGSRHLIDDISISYVFRTPLEDQRTQRAPNHNVLYVGDPIFQDLDSSRLEVAGHSRRTPPTQRTQLEIRPLPSTRKFGERLQQKYKSAITLFGEDASEGKVRASLQKDSYRYVVFATHGISFNEIPGAWEPSIVLSHPTLLEDPSKDGFLTASDILQTGINADVTMLMACSTAVGKIFSGEGIYSLARAFKISGSKKVVASLWVVEDQSTNLLTEYFMGFNDKISNTKEALRRAKIELRKNAKYRHPYYWAPFILYE